MSRAGRLARYATCGILTTLVYLAAGHGLQVRLHHVVASSSLAFLVAVAFNYALQQNWVFASATPVSHSLPRYAAMVATGLLVNALVVGVLAPRMDLLWAQALAAAVVVLGNAVLSFAWVFRMLRANRPPDRRAPPCAG